MGALFSTLKQCYFIPAPPLTEKNLPDQTGKVHIVTGGYAGCGKELVKILYQRNAAVYCAGRDKTKADRAIQEIHSQFPESNGRLEFLQLDLADLSTIKRAADEFLARETRLDVLTNNAGVMVPPKGSVNAHGHELMLGTNCLGPFLLTSLLTPLLKRTAAQSPAGSVRVTWAASLASYGSPKGGVAFDEATGAPTLSFMQFANYSTSKAANNLLASEFARRHAKDGILSASWNPGNLRTELQRHSTYFVLSNIVDYMLLYPAVYGAYTELYAGWSQDITAEKSGCIIVPWGRDATHEMRPDVLMGMKPKSEGGYGSAEKFWEYCEKETKKYA